MRRIIALIPLLVACGSGNGDPADTDTEEPRLDQVDMGEIPADPSPDVSPDAADPAADPTEDLDGEEIASCTSDEDCDDGDLCTTDTCSSTGTCENVYSSTLLTIGSTTRVTSTTPDSFVTGLEWTGSEFGVTWHEMGTSAPGPVYFKRLSSDGAVIGSNVLLSDASATAISGPLVWSGSEFGLAWRESSRVYFDRMSGAGTAVGAPIDVSGVTSSFYEPAIAWSGSEYAVAWSDSTGIHLARVEPRGYVVGTPTTLSGSRASPSSPRLAWSASEYGLAWSDHRGSSLETYIARISPTGTEVASPTLVATTPWSDFEPKAPGLAWSGSEYGLAWFGEASALNTVSFVRLSGDGAEIGSSITVTSTSSAIMYLDADWARGSYGLAWTDFRHGNNEILFSVVSPTGTIVASDLNLTNNASDSQFPVLVWTGSLYGFAWDDMIDSSTNREVYFTLLTVCPGP